MNENTRRLEAFKEIFVTQKQFGERMLTIERSLGDLSLKIQKANDAAEEAVHISRFNRWMLAAAILAVLANITLTVFHGVP